MATKLGPMIEPMIEKMQSSLKIKSNKIFDADGQINDLKRSEKASSIYTGTPLGEMTSD